MERVGTSIGDQSAGTLVQAGWGEHDVLDGAKTDLHEWINERFQFALLIVVFHLSMCVASSSQDYRPEVNTMSVLPIVHLLICFLNERSVLEFLQYHIGRSHLCLDLHTISQMYGQLPNVPKRVLVSQARVHAENFRSRVLHQIDGGQHKGRGGFG